MDFFLGEIRLFPYQRIPRGWLECNGASLQVNTNQALFSLLSNRYGGDGRTTFNVPDLRGRVPVGSTDPSGLAQQLGSEGVTLTENQMPQHTHNANVFNGPGNIGTATGAFPATTVKPAGPNPPAPNLYGTPVPNPSANMNPTVIGTVGGQPHENRQPSLVFVYCISTTGIYPSHS
jgi:microcystin-dependent protein